MAQSETTNQDNYKLHEAIADIAFIAGEKVYYSGNSREDTSNFILWAHEFEAMHKDTIWGETTDLDYIEAIQNFTMQKILENPLPLINH